MDKHIKRLDVKIKDLQNEGLFPAEQIPLPQHPSISDSRLARGLSHSRNASRRVSPSIHVRSSSLNLEKSALSAASTPAATNTANPLSTAAASGAASVGTPGSASGHDNKRRRLTSVTGASVGSNLGTAIIGATPPISSTLANAGATTPGPGSAGLPGRGSVETGRPTDGNGLLARTGPSIKRGGMKHGGAGHKRRVQHEQEDEEEDEEEDDDDDEENGDDKRLYCYCQQVSWGNMVACDDSDCRYEWFHWGKFSCPFVPVYMFLYISFSTPPIRLGPHILNHPLFPILPCYAFRSPPLFCIYILTPLHRMCQPHQRTTGKMVL